MWTYQEAVSVIPEQRAMFGEFTPWSPSSLHPLSWIARPPTLGEEEEEKSISLRAGRRESVAGEANRRAAP